MWTVTRREAKAIVCAPDGTCLIVQNIFPPFSRGWGLVGGGIRRDESPERALVREMKEETGFLLTRDISVESLGCVQRASKLVFIQFARKTHLFLIHVPSHFLIHRGWEIRDTMWVDASELHEKLSPYYRSLLSTISLRL